MIVSTIRMSLGKGADFSRAEQSVKQLTALAAEARSTTHEPGIRRAMAVAPYSGIFPCFFSGFLSRFVSSISSA
jgi:hypothetical protein